MNVVDTFLEAGTGALERTDALVLDMSDLSFLDSSGIRGIIALAERDNCRSVLIRRASGGVAKVLGLTGIAGRSGITIEGT